jgi:Bacterial regulatory helix-turn-helix protein, lysR family
VKLPPEFDLHALDVFVMTVELGGMSQCANHLQVTQSAVLQTIAKLEASIAAPLFDRTMRPMGLTASGKALFARGQTLIALLALPMTMSAKARTCQFPASPSQCRSAWPINQPPRYFPLWGRGRSDRISDQASQ